jgi:phasin
LNDPKSEASCRNQALLLGKNAVLVSMEKTSALGLSLRTTPPNQPRARRGLDVRKNNRQQLEGNTMSGMSERHQQSYSTAVENMRDFNLRMIDMAQTNTEAVFEVARQLATVKTPSEMIELCTSHARRQFETLSAQTKELTALGQKLTGESAEPFARTFNQAFSKAS